MSIWTVASDQFETSASSVIMGVFGCCRVCVSVSLDSQIFLSLGATLYGTGPVRCFRFNAFSRLTHPHDPDRPEVRLLYIMSLRSVPQRHRPCHRVWWLVDPVGCEACPMTVHLWNVFPVRSLNEVLRVAGGVDMV